ncbi:MAG: 4-(cytidine 5'-diphospho)-2-C-methyl-D-erythritol kinase [Porphyromonas sp.]|nr:4-(cytidine 5'-diphospho)-2-C-methyl-D-erythritol kinase [Porphyromonas sp.]
MLTFPKAKINLGLEIVEQRPDGYHNLQTLFYPVPLTDILEICPGVDAFSFDGGEALKECPMEQNLVVKAYRIMADRYQLPPVKILLRKHIPHGAGLGGGSSDAASTLMMLNEMFDLRCTRDELCRLGAKLGADVPCFLYDSPTYGEGIGDILTPFEELSLEGCYLLLILPNIHISTPEAYAGVSPLKPEIELKERLRLPLQEWRDVVQNRFESSLFVRYPLLARIKEQLYDSGALYASMSGSGSAMYGIYDKKPDVSLFDRWYCSLMKL